MLDLEIEELYKDADEHGSYFPMLSHPRVMSYYMKEKKNKTTTMNGLWQVFKHLSTAWECIPEMAIEENVQHI